jgi:hypothetical protein
MSAACHERATARFQFGHNRVERDVVLAGLYRAEPTAAQAVRKTEPAG